MAKVEAAGDRLRRPGVRRRRRAARRDRIRGVHRRRATRTSPGAMPDDEWDAISLNYTSGTTGNPEGRGLPPPRRLSAGARQRRHLRHGQASGLSLDAADVPLQRLVLPLVDLGRSPAPMSACARCAPTPMYDAHRRAQGHASVRRADRDVDAAQRAGRREEAAAARGRVLHRRRAAARGGAAPR